MRAKLEKIDDFLSKYDCETLLKNIKSIPYKTTIEKLSSALNVMNRNAFGEWVTYNELTKWINPKTGTYVDVLKHYDISECFSIINAFKYFQTRKNNGRNEYYSDKEVVEEGDVIKIASIKNIFHNKIKHITELDEILKKKESGISIPSANFQPVETKNTEDLKQYCKNEYRTPEQVFNENVQHLMDEVRKEREQLGQEREELNKILNSEETKELIDTKKFFVRLIGLMKE